MDGEQVAVGHVLEDRPIHDLEQPARVVVIRPVVHHVHGLRGCQPVHRAEVPGRDGVLDTGRIRDGERPAAPQVAVGIDLLGLAQERIPAWEVERFGVAVGALGHGVDVVAAQAHEGPVLAGEVERQRCDVEALFDAALFVVAAVLRRTRGWDENELARRATITPAGMASTIVSWSIRTRSCKIVLSAFQCGLRSNRKAIVPAQTERRGDVAPVRSWLCGQAPPAADFTRLHQSVS